MEKTLDAIFAKATRRGECLIWQGGISQRGPYGYGRASFSDGSIGYVHRAVFEIVNGPIPKGIHVCHHCDTPKCIEPKHLFAGTQRDNIRDAAMKGRIGHPSHKRLLTHCKAGHAFDETNTIYIQGGRRCRACKNRRDREYQTKKRA